MPKKFLVGEVNDKIVSRYMDHRSFEDAAFAVLSKVI